MQKFEITVDVNIKDKDIAAIVESAKQGTKHWSMGKQKNPESVDINTYIICGGTLAVRNDVEEYPISYGNLINGIQMYITNPTFGNIIEYIDGEFHIDKSLINQKVTDSILTYAAFGLDKYNN